MNKEIKRLYKICRATETPAHRALEQAKSWHNKLDNTFIIQFAGRSTNGLLWPFSE